MHCLIKTFLFVGFVSVLFLGTHLHAQTLHQDLQGVWRAEVLEVLDERVEPVPGTEISAIIQELSVELLEGEREGELVTFTNDFITLEAGDVFFMNYLITINGDEFYSVREVDRRGTLALLFLLFAAVIIFFGGWQGVRSLISLAGSLLVIGYVLLPTLLSGFPPVLTSIFVAGLVLFAAIFFTHGFNRYSSIAFGGTMIAVALTGLLAWGSVAFTGLTGFTSDESTYLNLATSGELNFVGLLLAAIIIGALGVLDDIAVTQVAVVRELFAADQSLSKFEVYKRALRVGREHVSALVNTLVLAYTGAALPLLLLFSGTTEASLSIIANREIFATEIVRALVGSIGLILTVPITTYFAATLLERHKDHLSHDHTSFGHTHHH